MIDIDPYWFEVTKWCHRNPMTTITMVTILWKIAKKTKTKIDDYFVKKAAALVGMGEKCE
jgi:hypothetical protein